jgi:hypothetical protein
MSSDPRDLTVRILPLDGQWETLGVDRYRNIVPENVQFTFNEWGPRHLWVCATS